jgi:GT2 family glycosyltransferase
VSLEVPSVAEPLVSVVVVTYGQGELVLGALRALVRRTPPCYELVLVDNASPDGTGELLAEQVHGARLVRAAENLGFGTGANLGALASRGRYLCFLNSDAFVERGWLEPLADALEADPRLGAAVPMILNTDGSLQEAGSVVRGDGATQAVGFGDDPCRFQYRYPRLVDYGSGACLCVRRSAFSAAGGFDPVYGKGYYEDVDLCLRLALMGLPTRYVPASRVRHVRGASSAPADLLRLRDANAAVFAARWRDELRWRPPLARLVSHPHRVAALRDAHSVDRVLVVAARLPASLEQAPARLALRLLGEAAAARVVVVGLVQGEAAPTGRVAETAAVLAAKGCEVVTGISDWGDWMRRHRFHFSVVVLDESVAGDDRLASLACGLVRHEQPQARLVAVSGPRGVPPWLAAGAELAPHPESPVLDALALGLAPRRRATR